MKKSITSILRGGLDLVTPGLAKRPGSCIGGKNYEMVQEGCRRCDGYERLDGQPKPSEAWPLMVLNFDAGTTDPGGASVKITGSTSGATGWLYQAPVVTSGSYAANDAAGFVIMRNVSGTFQDDEAIEYDASGSWATANGVLDDNVYEDEDTKETTRQAAIEQARTLIGSVGGTGDVLGVATYSGDKYAWRENGGNVSLYKATESGWVEQTFGHTLDFTSGTASFSEGDTVTGGTSGATATVERVVLTSGAWDGTGAGYLVLSGITGTFQSETITSAGGSAAAGGAQAAITLATGGTFTAMVHNFYGSSNLRRMYFVNGQGYAHEWDGSVLAPIRTGLSASLDKPTHIAIHSNHLLLGFRGGYLAYSGTGTPLSFLAIDGAGDENMGEDITGMISSAKTATVISGRNRISYFTGYDVNDFALQDISDDSGAKEGTLQIIGEPYFIDDIGLRSLSASQRFGDWDIGTSSDLIEPLFKTKKAANVTIVGSMRVRRKNQYRLFFSDGTGISFYFGGKIPEAMTFELGFTPTCFASGEESDGDEILLAGATDGKVYELDAGQGHDGTSMDYFVRFAFENQKMPNRDKNYNWAQLEATGEDGSHSLTFVADYSYGDVDMVSNPEEGVTIRGAGGFYDTAVWDEFFYDNPTNSRAWIELNGVGENISYVFFGSSTYESPHVLSAITTLYTPLRSLR